MRQPGEASLGAEGAKTLRQKDRIADDTQEIRGYRGTEEAIPERSGRIFQVIYRVQMSVSLFLYSFFLQWARTGAVRRGRDRTISERDRYYGQKNTAL